MKIEVKESGDKDKPWGLFIDDILFGVSKHRFDADFAKNVLERLMSFSSDELIAEVKRRNL